MSGTTLWVAVLAASLGCYLLKLAGLSVPAGWVEQPWVARVVDFVPAALLAALVAVQTFASGQHLVVDARLAGLVVAALDSIVPAAFLALLWPRLHKPFPEARVQRRVAVGGAVVALALTPFVPAGVQVIAAVVAVALAGRPHGTARPTAAEEMA